jgi:hypothetical protein
MTTPPQGAAGRKLRRDVSPLGLMFVSLGSIIGSGWLFGALYASQIAGPAAIIAWVAGGLVMLLLALVHAELGNIYPVAKIKPFSCHRDPTRSISSSWCVRWRPRSLHLATEHYRYVPGRHPSFAGGQVLFAGTTSGGTRDVVDAPPFSLFAFLR